MADNKGIKSGLAADGPWRDLDSFRKQNRLNTILAQTKKLGLPAEMVQYLESRQRMPSIVAKRYIPDGATAQFDYPIWGSPQMGLAGEISLREGLLRENPAYENRAARSVSHELTHATERQLHWQAQERLPEDAQYRDAYQKLLAGPTIANNQQGSREELIKKLAPKEWITKHADYRATPGEATAWGVENSVKPAGTGVESSGPLHLDSTLATELAILLELAQRKKR